MDQKLRYKVVLYPSDEGVAVGCPALPGCWSQGADEKEALENIADAFKATLAYHLESNSPIPWREGDPEFFAGMANTIERWIVVDV